MSRLCRKRVYENKALSFLQLNLRLQIGFPAVGSPLTARMTGRKNYTEGIVYRMRISRFQLYS